MNDFAGENVGATDDPMQLAYEFAWKGFQEAEFEATDTFGVVTENLAANPDETAEDEPVESTADGSVMVSQESITTYELVDISVAANGLKLAVGLAQLATITTVTPEGGGAPAVEVTVQNRAEVVDTSFEPPMATGEEYVRPPVTLMMTEDGEDVAEMHIGTAERPETYEKLLEVREDQKRYVALLGLVHMARRTRGEITA